MRIARAGAAHSTVDGLRKLGWHVVNQMTTAKRGVYRVTHSEYLIPAESLPVLTED